MVQTNGTAYYRTRMEDTDGKRVALYGKTRDELYGKVLTAQDEMESRAFRRMSPTVKEYCEKWLLMQSVQVRTTTLTDYRSKVKHYINKTLVHKLIRDVTTDNIRIAFISVFSKSVSVYKSVYILYRCIFCVASESRVISEATAFYFSRKAGGVPQKD